MRILDRYVAKQVIPVWLWCILLFVFVAVITDLFGHLEEIFRYRIPPRTIWEYYLNFIPLVFVRASPLAILFSAAFVTSRLIRHAELLAMHASGISLVRAGLPFVFVGWMVSVLVFAANERLVPPTSAIYERIRHEAFKERQQQTMIEQVATIDHLNRLYHARVLDVEHDELKDLTIIDHDAQNRAVQTLYARRGIFTPHGWLLLYGTLYRTVPGDPTLGEPTPFVERLLKFPVTPASFRQPETQPETLSSKQLRRLIRRMRSIGLTDVRRYQLELASKVTLPLMNLVVCLIGFLGATRYQDRGHLRGLGLSLLWGIAYYGGVAVFHGLGREGTLPVILAVWFPHLLALWYCARTVRHIT